MFRFVAVLFLLASFVPPAVGQDADDPDSAAESAAAAEDTDIADEDEEEQEEPVEFDETGLDDQGFSNEDDDFDPTEEIPADQSIEFPADI